jgi:hypothetical protein
MSESNRRHFLISATALGVASQAFSRTRPAQGRVIGANDRINLGVIGMGGRGSYLARVFSKIGAQNNSCQIVAVCDVYQKRLNAAKEAHKCDGYLDYREVLNRKDVDAVIIATPGSLARTHGSGSNGPGQGRLPGKAHVSHHRRGAPAHQHRA